LINRGGDEPMVNRGGDEPLINRHVIVSSDIFNMNAIHRA
jgi:hypothetical protein